MNANDRITAATGWMLTAHPWWASLRMHLSTEASTAVPTAGTDGDRLLYNPSFVDSITDTELVAVLAHEVAHCALRHITRCGGRDRTRWNIAADACANALLAADGFALPVGCVPPAALELTAEDVYNQLPDSAPCPTWLPGDVLPSVSSDASDKGDTGAPSVTALDQKWREIVASARGLQPGSIDRSAVSSQPDIDPWSVLSVWFSSHRMSSDRSWSRISRRVPWMPGKRSELIGFVAICIDTSGSIDSHLLGTFLGHCKTICASENVEAVLISADADIHKIVRPGDDWPTLWTGGGGTDFRPALKTAEELRPDCIVYFTDGDGTFPQTEPRVPVLWALSQNCNVPWGRKIRLTKE